MHSSVALLFGFLLLSGCIADAPEPVPEIPVEEPTPEISDLFGIVIDEKNQGLPNVVVALKGFNISRSTDVNGSYDFDGEELRGRYNVTATREGYLPVEAGIEIQEGFSARIIFTLRNESTLPLVKVIYEFSGYLPCVNRYPAPIGEDCPIDLGGDRIDRFRVPLNFEDRLSGIDIEAVWNESPQGALEVVILGYDLDLLGTELLVLSDTQGVHHVLRSGELANLTDYAELGIIVRPSATGTGLAYQRSFESFFTMWYNQEAPEGYSILG